MKSQIPLRAGPWDETIPGYAEIDLVAHCGDNAAGKFAFTLDFTDIATEWVERRTALERQQERTHRAPKDIKQELLFPLLGIDSDNDSIFINHQLWRWWEAEKIALTRSRAYKKNDNARVEQKNWTCVRRVFGHIRIETKSQVDLMNKLYGGPLRIHTNFFKPTMKCIEKKWLARRL